MTRTQVLKPTVETNNFKIWLFRSHGYHTPKLKNIAIFAIAFSPHNFKILPTCYMELFRVSNLTYIFGRQIETCTQIIITIISNITALMSHNVISFVYFVPMSHGVSKKAPTFVSRPHLPLTTFSPVLFVVLQEILY